MDIAAKRRREKQVVSLMIGLYCRRNHGVKQGLCPDCEELAAYSTKRIELCPVMAEKTFCSKCQIHCYQPAMREKIKTVMSFSGPRMIFYHPLMALRHLLSGL